MVEGQAVFHRQGMLDKRLNSRKSDDVPAAQPPVQACPECGSRKLYRDGLRYRNDGSEVQRWLCRSCGYRFSHDNSNKECQAKTDRQVCVILQETKNLASAAETKTVAGDTKTIDTAQGQILEYAWKLKKRGLAEVTIKHRMLRLRILMRKGAILADPETVETVLATEDWTPANKFQYVMAYTSFTKTMGIQWTPIKVRYEPKQPFLPLEEEIDQLIAGCGRRTATILQVLKDTGARIGEVAKLQWTDINVKNLTVSINMPEKGSSARTLKVTEKTIGMISNLPKRYGLYLFNQNARNLQSTFARQRDKLALKLQNPRIRQIHFHTLRHVFATRQYRKTHFNWQRVQHMLGHKRASSTERYTHDVNAENCEYETARAETADEAEALRRAGYEPYDTFIENGRTIRLYSRVK